METERIALSHESPVPAAIHPLKLSVKYYRYWSYGGLCRNSAIELTVNLRTAMALGHQDFTQKKPDQLVYLELGVGNGGMLLTISEDGFRFRAVTPVRANTSMPFAFSLD